MFRYIALFTAMIVLAGCGVDTGSVFTPYNEDSFHSWMGNGPASLHGQAFYRLPSGRVISCAGTMVTLLPANGYNHEAEQTILEGKGFPENYNRAAQKFTRQTVCDGYGKFSFKDLPSQNWIVLIHLTWQEPNILGFGKVDQGGFLVREVLTNPGDNNLVMSNQQFVKGDGGDSDSGTLF